LPDSFSLSPLGAPASALPRAALLVSGEARAWAGAPAFAASHAAHLIAPLAAEGFAVDVVFCLDDSDAARAGAAAAAAPGAAAWAAGAASAAAFFFDAPPTLAAAAAAAAAPSPAPAPWPQFARLARCRACAAPPRGARAWARFVVVRPDLLVQAPLPRALAPGAVHARVRAAVNVGGLTGAHFSFMYERSFCWEAVLPRASAATPPYVMPDDALAAFDAGAAADVYFGAHAFYAAGGAAASGAAPCGLPRELDGGAARAYIETRLGDALACRGVALAPLALPARLARHMPYGPCYAADWADKAECAGALAPRDCRGEAQPRGGEAWEA